MSLTLSPTDEAFIADSLRVWEVRRAVQVATSASHGSSHEGDHTPGGDAALAALLRCLLYELQGDIAAVSLLDDHTQYFLSVIPRSAIHNPNVTQDTGKWFGCQSISHHGGLCVRTLTMKEEENEPVFEIFDLKEGQTRSLPVVDGTFANFRHYSGVPIVIHGGVRIGALFVFRDKPAQQGLSRSHRHFMHETARQVVEQIELNIRAVQSERMLRSNSDVLSLLEVCRPSDEHQKAANARDQFSHIYQNAARLLLHAFELEGVIIQEFPWSKSDAKPGQPTPILGHHRRSGKPVQVQLPNPVVEQLFDAFPSGAVCHLLSEADGLGTFASSVPGSPEFSMEIRIKLLPRKETPEQFMFMPLWNTYHDKVSAFVLGWAVDSTRVYASTTDLLPLSSFGVATMSLVRRAEEQILDRKKNDFLGSVSHEMRSPLHGVLACIDLARETECRTQQHEMLDSASSCALQLRDNIDNILMYSNIGSPSTSRKQPRQLLIPTEQSESERYPSQTVIRELKPVDTPTDIMLVIEEIVAKERSKSKSITPSFERPVDALSAAVNSTWQTVVVVDSTPSTNLSLAPHSDLGIIFSNLLGNCLKFTGPSGCIRVSLDADEADVRLLFADSACGMSPDFVQHNVFVPFEQQNPLDPGMGLGLSLVYSAVHRLDGTISLRTDEAEGTDFSVSLPRNQLTFSFHETHTSSGRHSPLDSVKDFSFLKVELLPPERWKGHVGDPLRDERCLDAFITSLTRTLKNWCMADLKPCTQPWTTNESNPDMIFLLHSDIERLREIIGSAFHGTQKVILCPDKAAESHVQASAPGQYTTILGPIVPWKIVAAVDKCSQRVRGRTKATMESAHTHGVPPLPTDMHRGDENAPTQVGATAGQEGQMPSTELASFNNTMMLPVRPSPASPQREPKILLVDDNAINLRVAGMYTKKCSTRPSVSAGGGRTAIDKFKAARSTSNAFDIILLDLSMPEISGFEVTAAVRELELEFQHQDVPRVYIAALTGLVSDKDRDAAFAAGIDEYVTKPASLGDLRNVVENWRTSTGLG